MEHVLLALAIWHIGAFVLIMTAFGFWYLCFCTRFGVVLRHRIKRRYWGKIE